MSVSVSELKASLSRYLRVVRRGGEVQVLDRGVPVARLVGMPAPTADRERLSRLVRVGLLGLGRGDAQQVLARPALRLTGADVSGALAEGREERL